MRLYLNVSVIYLTPTVAVALGNSVTAPTYSQRRREVGGAGMQGFEELCDQLLAQIEANWERRGLIPRQQPAERRRHLRLVQPIDAEASEAA